MFLFSFKIIFLCNIYHLINNNKKDVVSYEVEQEHHFEREKNQQEQQFCFRKGQYSLKEEEQQHKKLRGEQRGKR